jgi:hypothetical protein
VGAVGSAFRKMHAMDYYITKYQGKMMQSMTPLFAAMTQGIRKLEEQERQAEKLADKDPEEEPARKKRRTKEDLQRLARQKCIRLASMANRCYWLSSAEIAVFVLTGGDTIKTHQPTRIFTRQLQWIIQECKRILNGEAPSPADPNLAGPAALGTTALVVDLIADAPSRTTGASQPGAAAEAEEADEDHDADEVTAEIVSSELLTTTTNFSDDFAHRGPVLRNMLYYVYAMHVERKPKSKDQRDGPLRRFVPFDKHYPLSKSHIQVVRVSIGVPVIEGFQCPSWEQDAEQNSLLKHVLFTPWYCDDAMDCGSHRKFERCFSNGDAIPLAADRADEVPPPPSLAGVRLRRRRYTLARGWCQRKVQILIEAERAEARQQAAQKYLTLADTTLWCDTKAEKEALDEAKEWCMCGLQWARTLGGTIALEPLRRTLAFAGLAFRYHAEQCTLSEYASFVARDVMAHVDLAAEARKKEPKSTQKGVQSESEHSEGDAEKKPAISVADIGNAGWDAQDGELEPDTSKTVSVCPLRDHQAALRAAFQKDALEAIPPNKKLTDVEKHFQGLDRIFGAAVRSLDFKMDVTASASQPGALGAGLCLKADADHCLALQKTRIQAARQQGSCDMESADHDMDPNFEGAFLLAAPQEVCEVPIPDALLGPGHVALALLNKAGATEEQIDAVSLLALSLQRRFDSRVDKSSVRLPVATATGNHEAAWLGGGGVGKTRTLRHVVEPLAVTYFGPEGYLPTAQANHAAQQLGPRGRTIHSVNGLLATSSLVTARLSLNDFSRKKMDRLKGELGVEVTDELGCVQGELLHADCLRTTYGRAQRYNLDSTQYMRPQEKWGRMAARILCGDFLQLPPVPASASMVAPPARQSYEHQQGVALLASVPYVIDFVEMKRFDDDRQLQLLQNMRVPGGRPVPDETWSAILASEYKATKDAAQLLACSEWHEAAYDWRTVSFAMQTKARLRAKQAGKILYYIQAVDKVSQHVHSHEFPKIIAEPNLSRTKKLAGILPAFIGMDMTMQGSLLPPQYVTGTVGKLIGIELHPDEPKISGRQSVKETGCVLLTYMPKCFYLEVPDTADGFLRSDNADAPQLGADVIAIQPDSRTWTHCTEDGLKVAVTRRQIPLLPDKISTLHGIQGKTADPGLAAHWKFPKNLPPEALWLAHYVILSRPRSLANLLSFGLPSRKVLEAGPPKAITEAFQRLFGDKIEKTKEACAEARRELGWPSRSA